MMGLDEMGYEHEDEHKDMHSCDTNISPTTWQLHKHCLLLYAYRTISRFLYRGARIERGKLHNLVSCITRKRAT
jgi:hypothetical protein